jgi:hypothetical protein
MTEQQFNLITSVNAGRQRPLSTQRVAAVRAVILDGVPVYRADVNNGLNPDGATGRHAQRYREHLAYCQAVADAS